MNKMMVFASAVLLSLAMAASAYAAGIPVAGLFADAPDSTLLSDNSAEFFFDMDASGSVTKDDIFIGIVGINSIENPVSNAIGQGTLFNEITAVQALKVDTVTPLFTNAQGILMSRFTEVPLTAADSGIFDFADFNSVGLVNDGMLFALVFEDSAQNYDRDSTIANGFVTAQDGSLRLGLSIVPGNGDFLTALGPDDVDDFTSLAFNEQVDGSNITLNGTVTYQDWPGLFFNANMTGGNGGFARPNSTAQWPIFDNLDFTLTATAIPEPGTLSLLGLGLLGACFYGRRNRK